MGFKKRTTILNSAAVIVPVASVISFINAEEISSLSERFCLAAMVGGTTYLAGKGLAMISGYGIKGLIYTKTESGMRLNIGRSLIAAAGITAIQVAGSIGGYNYAQDFVTEQFGDAKHTATADTRPTTQLLRSGNTVYAATLPSPH